MISEKKYTFLSDGLLPLLISVLPLTGCTSDSDGNEEQGNLVNFSLRMDGTVTRAVSTLDNIWPDNTEIAISNANNSYYYSTGSSSSVSAGVPIMLKPVSSAFHWTATDPGWQFSAWYPTSVTPADGMTVTVGIDQSTGEDAAYLAQDLLYCPPTDAPFRQTVPLTFYHQLCHVRCTINSFNTSNVVTKVTLGQNNIANTGKITTIGSTGLDAPGTTTVWTLEDADKTKTLTMRKNEDLSNPQNYMYTYECILPPQGGGNFNDAMFKISTDDNKSYSYISSFTFEAGRQYDYSLILSKSGSVIVATVTISNWGITNYLNVDADVPDDLQE